jgi:hypothetical protein
MNGVCEGSQEFWFTVSPIRDGNPDLEERGHDDRVDDKTWML